MENRIVKKCCFAKGKYFISINYEEGSDAKVLESNRLYSDDFSNLLKSLANDVKKYLELKENTVVRVSSIIFGSEKKNPKITCNVLYDNLQIVNMSLLLSDGEEGSVQDVMKSTILKLHKCCEEYISGEAAAA